MQTDSKGNRNNYGTKVFTKKLKSSHAFIGDKISFIRKGFLIEGIVTRYNENTVYCEISQADTYRLDLKSNTTVVNHKNYKLV